MPDNVNDDKTPNADPKPPVTPPAAPKPDEDLSKRDTSKFTNEQKDDYISQLKDENARRRIENREVKTELDKQRATLAKLQSDLKATADKAKGYEDEKRKATDAEKSEIERLQGRIAEMEKTITETTNQLQKHGAELKSKDLRVKQMEREALVERLVLTLGYNFASEFERDGFIAKMSHINENGEFTMSDEKAIYETNQFVTKNKQPPKTPPPGPPRRSNEMPLIEEVKSLTALSRKRRLTPEEMKRLNELIAMTGEA